ncbi:hypothetical protein ACIBL5_37870 [Streptomyces sp. NPDC050516]|uniref:hypothetical protein n=1 Tax=Streptomyces sp. NPDC050516 TaxID=3365621 RepID=UPI0037A9408A
MTSNDAQSIGSAVGGEGMRVLWEDLLEVPAMQDAVQLLLNSGIDLAKVGGGDDLDPDTVHADNLFSQGQGLQDVQEVKASDAWVKLRDAGAVDDGDTFPALVVKMQQAMG